MLKHTPLHNLQKALPGVQWAPFAGWEMALHYGSAIKEYEATRNSCGIFDVSHMTLLEITGTGSKAFLRSLLANDIDANSKDATYSCILNEKGGIIDDLIVYALGSEHYYLILNAGTYPNSVDWIQKQKPKAISIHHHQDPVILALQGPTAMQLAQTLLPDQATWLENATPFSCLKSTDHEVFLATTGYTGERGIEIITSAEKGQVLWQQCMTRGVQPCGLAARDLLRLEMGYVLSGQDMDESTSPLSSNIGWSVSFADPKRDFIGKDALLQEQSSKPKSSLVGITLLERGVLRHNQTIIDVDGNPCGTITSGAYSPLLKGAIGLARIQKKAQSGPLFVDIRGKQVAAQITKPPFYQKKA